MSEVAKLPVPQGGAVAALPVPGAFNPEQARIDAWNATSTDFSKGVRSGFNQLGSMFNAFAGTFAEGMGLTEFAKQRMLDAEQYAKFADAVGPDVRDYRAINDTESLLGFMTGHAGSALAQVVPAAVGGLVGSRIGGLRGAFTGLAAGSFVPNAGEQAMNIKDAQASPGAKVANMLGVGAVNAGLDALGLMVPAGRAVKPALRTGSVASTVGKAAGAEALTEGAQDYVGQVGTGMLVPGREIDPHSVVNAALAGGIGGATFGAGQRLSEVAPGVVGGVMDTAKGVVDGVMDTAKGLGRRWTASGDKEEFDKKVGLDPVPLDDDSELMKEAKSPGATEASLSEAMDRDDKNEESWLRRGWSNIRDSEFAQKVKSWATDPDAREELKTYLRDKYDTGRRAVTERVLGTLRGRKPPEGDAAGAQKSAERTWIDDQMLDLVSNYVDERTKRHMTPEQLIELADAVKHDALHVYGQRDEDMGPRPGAFSEEQQTKDSQDLSKWTTPERDTLRNPDGSTASKAVGREQDPRTSPAPLGTHYPYFFKAKGREVVEKAQALLGMNEPGAPRRAATADQLRAAETAMARKQLERRDRITSTITKFLTPEARQSANRGYFVSEFKRLLEGNNYTPHRTGTVDPENPSATLADYVMRAGQENMRVDNDTRALFEAAGHMFGGRRKEALDELDAVLHGERTKDDIVDGFSAEYNLSDEDAQMLEDMYFEQRDRQGGFEGDVRVNRHYPDVEQAKAAIKAAEKNYPRDSVVFRMHYDAGKGVFVSAEAPAAAGTLTERQWSAIAPFSMEDEAGDRVTEHRGESGFAHGTITVVRDTGMTSSEGKPVLRKSKVSIPNLTAEAIRRTDVREDGEAWNARMVLEGLSMLLGDPNVRRFGDKTVQELGFSADTNLPIEAWDIPDGTVVSAHKVQDKNEETGKKFERMMEWRDVKRIMRRHRGELSAQLEDTVNEVILAERVLDASGEQRLEQRDNPVTGETENYLPATDELSNMLAQAEAQLASDKEVLRIAQSVVNKIEVAVGDLTKDRESAVRSEGEAILRKRGIDLSAAEAGVTEEEAAKRRERQLAMVAKAAEKSPVVQKIDGAIAGVKAPMKDARSAVFFATKDVDRSAGRVGVIKAAIDRVEAELNRRRETGDFPLGEGSNLVDDPEQMSRPSMASRDDEGVRRYVEETGLPVDLGKAFMRRYKNHPGAVDVEVPAKMPAANTDRRGFEPHEVGADNSAPGPVSSQRAKGILAIQSYGLSASQLKAIARTVNPRAESLEGLTLQELREVYATIHEVRGPAPTKTPSMVNTGGNMKHVGPAFKSEKAKASEFYDKMKSEQDTTGYTPVSEAEAREIIERVLGADVALELGQAMAHAGEFANVDGVESIRLALGAHVGVLHHETAHAFFERLIAADPKAAQQLLAAAGSPQIVTRLRALLRGQDRALEQLKIPTERVAYMYQFWVAGQLRVGPRTATWFDKVKAYFRSIVGLWSETFNDVNNIGKAEALFDMFHRGELADRNAVADVLRERMPKTVFDRFTEMAPGLSRTLDRVLFTAVGNVRQMNIPALNKVMDLYYPGLEAQKRDPGFMQEKLRKRNEFGNRFSAIIEGASEDDVRRAGEILREGLDVGPDGRVMDIVRQTRLLLRDIREYMVAKGVKEVAWDPEQMKVIERELGNVANYFPRVYDPEAISSRREEFLAMLSRHGVANPVAVYDSVVSGDWAAPSNEDGWADHAAGLTPFAPETKGRRLDIPADELAPYLVKDFVGTMNSYMNRATRRAEYAARFKNDGRVIKQAIEDAKAQGMTDEQERTFRAAVSAMDGTIGGRMDPQLRTAFGAITTYQNIRLLPLALFSSMVDPMGIVVRGGTVSEAFDAMVRGVRGLVSERKDDAYHAAELLGIIATAHDAHMVADAYGTQQYLPQKLQKANSLFFKYNGMESWNRSMRVAATAAALNFIERHVQTPGEHSERWLAELGLKADEVELRSGHVDLSDPKIAQAVMKWVDGAVLRPSAAIRPAWMSDPNWMLVSHLKQFTYGFQKTIISRVVHEASLGNWSPALALASYVPMIIAIDALRAVLTPGSGDDEALKRLSAAGMIARGVQRAGLVGPGQYAVDAYGDLGHGKLPFSSFAGPTVQQMLDVGYAVASPKGGSVAHELARAVPGYVFVR